MGRKKPPPVEDVEATCPYALRPSKLVELNENRDSKTLRELGGVSGLAAAIGSDAREGLDPAVTAGAPGSISEHARVYGRNVFKAVPPKNFFALCWENLQDPIILLLIAAALISTILGSALEEQRKEGEWIEGIAIWVAVLIVVAVGAGNDYQKDLQFRKLNAVKDAVDVKVVRAGRPTLVPNFDVVVGDVMLLDAGDKVAADGVMIDGHHLVIDEASLTGESEPIKKAPDEDPWCRSGTQVSEGSGRVLVVAVGEQSEWGKTMALVGEAGSDETPLQEKLGGMAGAIGKVGLTVSVASFLALVIKWLVTWCRSPEGCSSLKNHLNHGGLVEFFLYAVTIVVVAMPEGLPLAVTIALAYGMKKMMKDNNFVRVLAACETMGGATAICSDKTGTLTENRMTVTEGWFAGTSFDHAPSKDELPPKVLRDLSLNAALNSKAHLMETAGAPLTFVGNRTECALLVLARAWGVDYRQVRAEWEPRIAELFGFTSARKMASALVRDGDGGGGLKLYNKGAAEWVLERCTQVLGPDGARAPLGAAAREELIAKVVVPMASRGLRCICLAQRAFSAGDAAARPAGFFGDADTLDNELTAVAIVGIKDPLRREVPDAVATCQRAGITVRMVTGDNIHTARHIARECGILTEGGLALEGPEFRKMPAHELIPLLPRLQVLARSAPEDKLTLVSLLKAEGDVVAVTGDGTNDAPALKESDVGLAMGIAGTEVAKEAADIVILDDNFSSIVKSVLWGRSVFASIRKFLQFQLTVNFVALVCAFIGAVVGGRIPLNVLQLLWVNLIMDTMGALALATEDPHPSLLLDRPHGRNEPLITLRMWKHILTQGAYQLFWLFFFMYALPALPQWPRYQLTTQCGLIASGPLNAPASERGPGYCAAQLALPAADGGLGLSAADAAVQCELVSHCGWPCGGSRREGAACAAAVLAAGGGAYAAGDVPAEARDALCPGVTGHCDAFGRLRATQQLLAAAARRAEDADHVRIDSLLFNSFIFMQLFNEVNARRINGELNVFAGVHRSPIFLAVIAITVGLQVLIMQTRLGLFFKVAPLRPAEWGISVAIGAGSVPVGFAVRVLGRILPAVPRRRLRKTSSKGAAGGGSGSGARVHDESRAVVAEVVVGASGGGGGGSSGGGGARLSAPGTGATLGGGAVLVRRSSMQVARVGSRRPTREDGGPTRAPPRIAFDVPGEGEREGEGGGSGVKA